MEIGHDLSGKFSLSMISDQARRGERLLVRRTHLWLYRHELTDIETIDHGLRLGEILKRYQVRSVSKE